MLNTTVMEYGSWYATYFLVSLALLRGKEINA